MDFNHINFAQVFQAAKKKNPDILSYDKAMSDYDNIKRLVDNSSKRNQKTWRKRVWVEAMSYIRSQ